MRKEVVREGRVPPRIDGRLNDVAGPATVTKVSRRSAEKAPQVAAIKLHNHTMTSSSPEQHAISIRDEYYETRHFFEEFLSQLLCHVSRYHVRTGPQRLPSYFNDTQSYIGIFHLDVPNLLNNLRLGVLSITEQLLF